ncbi:hypothetical protein EJ02DRAFT_482752 [Clathrospora elynae]|uniref:Chromo domain-containing protein n=1 Tax=Clathrospora elynae TaxID=706981 RepID=A0A6A5S7G0_9PLEO|nr:hypothetical protein EJ02DRAFT_482752 [Clathrospora elynae]
MTRKGKFSPPAKRYSGTSNKILKQRPKHAAHTASDEDSGEDCARHLRSNKWLVLNARPCRSCRHKRRRNRGSADKDDKYGVQNILDDHVNRKKLQYRVQWLGYDNDLEWYDVVNFKNSPLKLGEFVKVYEQTCQQTNQIK